MRKFGMFAVLMTALLSMPVFADEPQQITAEQYGSVRVPESGDEWMYWQEHYDVLERAAKERRHRGIAVEVEGCRTCQKMELYSPVYVRCSMGPSGDDYGCYPFTSSSQASCVGWPFSGCETFTSWVPKEVGNKCVTIGGTTDLSTMLTDDRHASSSMEAWLLGRFNLSPEQIAYGFSPYQWTVEGGTANCAGAGSTTQTWTTQVAGGISWSHQVKIWSCNAVAGSACSADTQVQP